MSGFSKFHLNSHSKLYIALALSIHHCMLLLLEVVIWNCSGEQSYWFLEIKNGTCNYHKFRENLG